MKNLKTNFFKLALAIAFSSTLASCYVSKTNVGNYQSGGTPTRHDRVMNVYVLWGLIPVNSPKISMPSTPNYQIVSKFNVLDVVIQGLTGGIVSTKTTKINTNGK